MFFYFKITSKQEGIDVMAIYVLKQPLTGGIGKGLYVKLEAESREEAVKKIIDGPDANDIWEFALFN